MYLVYTLDSSDVYINLKDYLYNYYTKYYLESILKRLQIIFINDNYHWFYEPYGSIVAVLISLILFIPLIIKLFKDKKINIKLNKNNPAIYILKVFVIYSISLYFLLPDDIPGQNIIYQRFSIFIWLGLIGLFSRISLNLNQLSKYKILLLISVIIFNIMVFEYFISFQNSCKDFKPEIFNGIKRSEKVYGLFYDSDFRGRPIFIHFHNYFTIWHKGISGGIVDYRFSIIKRKSDFNSLPPYNPWAGNLEKYNDEYVNVEYILFRGKDQNNLKGFIPFRKSNEWILFKNLKLNNK